MTRAARLLLGVARRAHQIQVDDELDRLGRRGGTPAHDPRFRNVLVFDNGLGRPDSEGGLYSRALELRLDEAAGTAVKAWEYRLEPDRYVSRGGSAYRLSNGNTLVNFSTTALEGVPLTVVEVAPDGSEVVRIDTMHTDGVPRDGARGMAYGGLGAIMGETMLRPPAAPPAN